MARTRMTVLRPLAIAIAPVTRLVAGWLPFFGILTGFGLPESNVPTPQFIVDAAVRALADGYTFYSENAGLPSLRRTLAEHYRRLHDVTLDPAREIVITASGLTR